VSISTLLFNPTQPIANALLAAKERRVRICGYFNGGLQRPKFSDRMISAFTRYHYNLVDEAYEHNTENRLYHKKVCLFDDAHCMVSNYNLTHKSAHCDYEIALFFKDARVNSALQTGFLEDRTVAHCYTDQSLKSIQNSKMTRLIGFIVTKIASHFFG
jgi:phosphatidylserine/phosphatidylglycerophosphate/cardiolipin synthase-like enzyme